MKYILTVFFIVCYLNVWANPDTASPVDTEKNNLKDKLATELKILNKEKNKLSSMLMELRSVIRNKEDQLNKLCKELIKTSPDLAAIQEELNTVETRAKNLTIKLEDAVTSHERYQKQQKLIEDMKKKLANIELQDQKNTLKIIRERHLIRLNEKAAAQGQDPEEVMKRDPLLLNIDKQLKDPTGQMNP